MKIENSSTLTTVEEMRVTLNSVSYNRIEENLPLIASLPKVQ